MKFIKITLYSSNDYPQPATYVQAAAILQMQSFAKYTYILISGHSDGLYVTETPEQIMELCK